ncbi:MAG: dynamin [Campylobacteraceae bacterium]|nr:dynamin [Campylobacteraceae bacterium]
MEWFDDLIKEFLKSKEPLIKSSSNPLLEKIRKTRRVLKEEEDSLRVALNMLERRTEEPMKVAITGQFSSGKSTFLNAMLSKDILPTGITPVTSKINYLRFGKAFQLQVHYHDGREAFYGIENIATFTDQRQNMEEIHYLTLYAPLPLLKEVVFVDTPGLNSQEDSDTQTTKKVLGEVDGIIWLTLIDNAGKQSEVEVLSKYMNAFNSKTLCVLNQKDKFSIEDIEKTLKYVQKSLGKFFSSIVAISAKQALKARSQSLENRLENAMDSLVEKIKKCGSKDCTKDLELALDEYSLAYKNIIKENQADLTSIYEASNIKSVFDFIDNEIRPKATESKIYAIEKELESLQFRLIKQHNELLDAYRIVENELEEFEKRAQKMFESLKQRFGKELHQAYDKIQTIIDTIASEIFNHIQPETKTRYALQKRGVFRSRGFYQPFDYQVAKIKADEVYKVLFYDENIIGKMFKRYVKYLQTIQDCVNKENELCYKDLEKAVILWQKKHEELSPKDEIYSKEEFAKMRRFASKAYEVFLKPFNDEIKKSYAHISSQFNHLSSAVSFNYQNATEVSVGFLERKISESIVLYEENPEQFPLYQPRLSEIKERLRTSFHLYELENMMSTNRTFLHKNYDLLMRQFSKIKDEHFELLSDKKSYHERQIKALTDLQIEP